MDWGMIGGLIGAIAGVAIGLLGGVIGTYFTVKNTQGPRERAFAIKASILGWVLVALFGVGMWLIPWWYNLLLVIPYVIALILGIWKWNETQFRIRKEESDSNASPGAVVS